MECAFIAKVVSSQAGKEEGAEDGKRKHSLRSQSSDGHSNGGNLLMRLLSRKSNNGRRKSVEGGPSMHWVYARSMPKGQGRRCLSAC